MSGKFFVSVEMARVICRSRAYLLVLVLAVLAQVSHAGIPFAYYAPADDSSAANLRTTLNDIVTSGFTGTPFDNPDNSASFAVIEPSHEDTSNSSNVILIYGGDSRPKTPHGGANSDHTTGGWDREHTWPKSLFSNVEPCEGDFHVLFPSDADINSGRSNSYYDTVGASTVSGFPDSFGNKATSSVFEPSDESKGRAARAVFYMDVRYEGESGEPDLSLTDTGTSITSGSNKMGIKSTLLQWHHDHPPTAFDRMVNQRLYNSQINANPFIDHPEWIPIIYASGPSWTMENSNTLAVTKTDRAPTLRAPGSSNIALLSLNVTETGQEWLLDNMAVSKLGTLSDAG
ncbi:MAG: endonuclease, partial [bacterium]